MPLPQPTSRRHLHTRAVTYECFLRDDGLWDIEARLLDSKDFDLWRPSGEILPAGKPVHQMLLRVTIDDEMTVCAIDTAMDDRPFPECGQGVDPMQRIVGARMGKGWRQAIEATLGGVSGCTHLRELLFNAATAAYQAVFSWREHLRLQAGEPASAMLQPPSHVGRCVAWDSNGAVVARIYPQFAGHVWKKVQP